jgi:hypothetical protein
VFEAGDLNDSQILAATRQTKGQSGATQFSLTLPSGRKLVSEWIHEDNLKAALQVWLDTVRKQAVADANEERLAKVRAAMLAQTGKDSPSASTTQNTSAAPATSAVERIVAAGVDPLEYARKQLDVYARRREELIGQRNVIEEELSSVTRQRERWFQVVKLLTESENV